jgi:hypothetical protein
MNNDPSLRELRAELQRLTASLRRDVLEGETANDSLSTLNRAEYLAKLVDLEEKGRLPRSTRWQIPAILFAVAVIVLVLVAIPVRRTAAVINIRCSALSLRLVGDRVQELTDPIELASLDLATTDGSVRLPMARDEKARAVPEREVRRDANGGVHLELATQRAPMPGGIITLKTITGAGGSLFEMRRVGPEAQLWLRWRPAVSLDAAMVSLKGWVTLPGDASTSMTLQHEPAKAVRIDLGDLGSAEWMFQPSKPVPFRPPILVQSVSFTAESSGRAGTPPGSAIRTGTLQVTGADAIESLREGEQLTMETAKNPLTITSLSVDGRDIVVRIEGDVTRLETALAGERRNRMPTLLGWIRGNPTLSLLWSAVLFLFGVMTGVSRWWKGE